VMRSMFEASAKKLNTSSPNLGMNCDYSRTIGLGHGATHAAEDRAIEVITSSSAPPRSECSKA
jgi:hypothetical protein